MDSSIMPQGWDDWQDPKSHSPVFCHGFFSLRRSQLLQPANPPHPESLKPDSEGDRREDREI
ncbi:hypothetical protein ACLOJK_017483 [Asimina triloba]